MAAQKKRIQTTSGQALVIIVLVLAVGLTIGLSVISRSVTDIGISRQEEEAARALSWAEAGIEEALKVNLGMGDVLTETDGNVTFTVTAVGQGGGELFDFGEATFAQGDTQTIWLIEYTEEGWGDDSFPAGGKITLCWGSDTENPIAIEASLIYDAGSEDYQLARGAYDADLGRTAENKFTLAEDRDGGNCGDLDLAFGHTIDLDVDPPGGFGVPIGATLYMLRLKLIYNDEPEPIAAFGNGANFPPQGKCYLSSAVLADSNVTRRVQQCQFYRSPPPIFDYVLFSGTSLIKTTAPPE